MSAQFREYLNTLNFSKLSLSKKKTIIDNFVRFNLSEDKLHCPMCGQPKGKIRPCKHVLYYLFEKHKLSEYEVCRLLKGDNWNHFLKYGDIPNEIDECCICLENIYEIEDQCLSCGIFFHKKCIKNFIKCPHCSASMKWNLFS